MYFFSLCYYGDESKMENHFEMLDHRSVHIIFTNTYLSVSFVLFSFKRMQAGEVAELTDVAMGVAAVVPIPTGALDGERTENIFTIDIITGSLVVGGVPFLGSRRIAGWN